MDIKKYTRLPVKDIKKLEKLEWEDIYNVIGELKDGRDFEEIYSDVKTSGFNWKSSFYAKYKREREKHDNLIENPPEIREGEIECPKCGSKQTIVAELQTRSADEGFTVYIYCYNPKCKAKTKHN